MTPKFCVSILQTGNNKSVWNIKWLFYNQTLFVWNPVIKQWASLFRRELSGQVTRVLEGISTNRMSWTGSGFKQAHCSPLPYTRSWQTVRIKCLYSINSNYSKIWNFLSTDMMWQVENSTPDFMWQARIKTWEPWSWHIKVPLGSIHTGYVEQSLSCPDFGPTSKLPYCVYASILKWEENPWNFQYFPSQAF